MPLVERVILSDESELLASLINKAGGGVISYLLDGLAPGFSGESLLAATMRDSGLYGPDSTVYLEQDGQPAALLIAYPSELHVVHPAMAVFVSSAKIKAVRPMLAAAVPDSLHIAVLWVDHTLCDWNVAVELLQRAAEKAAACGRSRLSILCRNSETEEISGLLSAGFVPHTEFGPEELVINGTAEGGQLFCKELGIR